MPIALREIMKNLQPVEQGSERRKGVARVFGADTLRWVAGGETDWCACDACWDNLPFWREVAALQVRWRQRYPRGGPQELGAYVWEVLSASRWKRLVWRFSEPGALRANRVIRGHVAGRWHLGELYEIVLRGLAQHYLEPAK